MYKKALAFALVGIFVYAGVSHAQMTSTNYQIRWDSISAGGSDTSNSASYTLRDSIGSSSGSRATSASYDLDSGYRPGIFDQIITFDLLIQNSTSVRAATAYVAGSISASSVGIVANDYVALIQNRGANQITGIGAGSILVDTLATNGVTPIIDGTNDYVYELTGSALAFGNLDYESVNTGIVAFEVTADNSNGYVVQIMEDGNLRDGATIIPDVADGAVTAGFEEYGARSSDSTISTSTFDTKDSAITSTGQSVSTSSSASYNERTFITLKVAYDDDTEAGDYEQVLTFIASGNF